MSDPHGKRGFEDEARFIASLSDLDRGLVEDEDVDLSPRSTVPDPPRDIAPSVPHATDADEAAARLSAKAFMRFADTEPQAKRRLLNLFPESALEPEQSSAERSDAASDPPAEPWRPAPTPPEQPFTVSTVPTLQSRAASRERAGQKPPDVESSPRGSRVTSTLIVGAFALLLLAGAGGALWLWRDAVTRTILEWEDMPIPPGAPVRDLPMPIGPVPPP